ncbi:hypothetical protein Nepgr_001899 [Nepenthes gracilis]|uniref:Uncharacterized protein n=1 Tax=Nepenthes gracilis TaxID=150966 RepID=A0AAD3P360_NEPGR|nr:hypothetical protein Nepgr_001899 [Nepenthes gracilis]
MLPISDNVHESDFHILEFFDPCSRQLEEERLPSTSCNGGTGPNMKIHGISGEGLQKLDPTLWKSIMIENSGLSFLYGGANDAMLKPRQQKSLSTVLNASYYFPKFTFPTDPRENSYSAATIKDDGSKFKDHLALE